MMMSKLLWIDRAVLKLSMHTLRWDYIGAEVESSGSQYPLMHLALDSRLDLIIICTSHC